MNGAILVINFGSSSLKFAVFRHSSDSGLTCRARGRVEGLSGVPRLLAWNDDGTQLDERDLAAAADPAQAREQALTGVLAWLEQHAMAQPLLGVGHRVVHGGTRFTGPTMVTTEVLAQMDQLSPLAPLHQPHNLAAIRTLAKRHPALPQVACFDTAFHATQPAVARAFGLPRRFEEAGVRRYGFHGLSYEYIASVLPDHLGGAAHGRVIVAHLGNGASLCALRERRSVATTMGFTALDGLLMGTRCGSLDPGVVLYLMSQMGMSRVEIEQLLYRESGLLGVSGLSADLRILADSSDPDARAAIDLYVYRIQRELGSLTAALGGLDGLVFTAGVGEHSAMIRQRVCAGAKWLGVALNDEANLSHRRCISEEGSRVSTWMIPTDEERMIAQHTQALLAVA